MPGPNSSNDTNEDWGAYRKLIVETLRRLSDSIDDLKDELESQKTRIQALENKTTDAHLDKIEKLVGENTKRISTIETEDSNNKLRRQIMTTGANALWGIIVIIIATYINVNFFH